MFITLLLKTTWLTLQEGGLMCEIFLDVYYWEQDKPSTRDITVRANSYISISKSLRPEPQNCKQVLVLTFMTYSFKTAWPQLSGKSQSGFIFTFITRRFIREWPSLQENHTNGTINGTKLPSGTIKEAYHKNTYKTYTKEESDQPQIYVMNTRELERLLIIREKIGST